MTDSRPTLTAPLTETDLTPLPEAAHPAPALQPPPQDEPGQELALPPSDTPYLDAHGFDPSDYEWIPVLRRPRADGWTPAKQRLFIEVLADTACVEQAARAVRMSKQSAYALRRAPGGEAFAAAWSAALQQGALKLADVAFERALAGMEEPVFDRSGVKIGSKTRYSERLMIFLLRAHMPERYAHAHRTERPAGAPPAPREPRMADALARLDPALPPEPHTLMPPDELDVAVEVADILQGKLPQRHQAVRPDPPLMPMGEDFERRLEAAKFGYDIGPDGELIKDEPERPRRRRSRRQL